ncbi:MAG: hypothetical protein ACLQG3_14525 [Terracidiphilus sp.]
MPLRKKGGTKLRESDPLAMLTFVLILAFYSLAFFGIGLALGLHLR